MKQIYNETVNKVQAANKLTHQLPGMADNVYSHLHNKHVGKLLSSCRHWQNEIRMNWQVPNFTLFGTTTKNSTGTKAKMSEKFTLLKIRHILNPVIKYSLLRPQLGFPIMDLHFFFSIKFLSNSIETYACTTNGTTAIILSLFSMF